MFKQLVLAAATVLAFAAVSGCASNAPAGASSSSAASSEQAVAAAAERLRLAMINPTPAALAPLVADDLSYGHSGGRVDTKDSFIGDLVAGKSDFVTIAISDQTIKVVGNTAIVRHTLTADTNDSGKPGKVQIKILGVWQQQSGSWKLLARQAVRVAA
jgi:hypothetical protein